jgi:transcriptional regulator with XRE-family HTH domain
MDNRTQGNVPRWTLGDRLRKVRRDGGYSSREFALLLGVNVSSLAHYETDRARPRDLVDLAQRVEATTGVPASWLLGLDGDCPSVAAGPAPATGQLPVVKPLFIDVPLFQEAG